jgi:Flp pilus assembly protein TadG
MMKNRLIHFKQDEDGAVAIMFALALLPIMGMAGASVDYSKATKDRARLQQAVDAAALAGVKTAFVDEAKGIDQAKKVFAANLAKDMKEYTPVVKYNPSTGIMNVTASGSYKTNFVSIIKINDIAIGAQGSAQSSETATVKKSNLVAVYGDSEASSYNRIYAYCFDSTKKAEANRGRTMMTPLFDNGGTKYGNQMPECGLNETISFRLYHVRFARENPDLWDSSKPRVISKTSNNDIHGAVYEFYTDTTMSSEVMVFNIENNIPMLETIVCGSLDECKPVSEGGIVPKGKNREPAVNSKVCATGKYMYFGWEDLPPGYGNTDKDYDDITYVIECPKSVVSKKELSLARLVK